MDKSLLNDIELDVRELKYWIDTASQENNPDLHVMAKRHIARMHANLDRLWESLEGCVPQKTAFQETNVKESCPGVSTKPQNNWKQALSINDSFRYMREVFGGNAGQMKQVMDKTDQLETWEEVMDYLHAQISLDEQEEVVAGFLDFLKSRFNQ